MPKTGKSPSARDTEKSETESRRKSSSSITDEKNESMKTPAKEKTHPPTSEMVNAAIAALQDRNGSSLQSIKKYIAATYNVDAEKLAIYIRKYLKSAVEKNIIIQTTGVGANGRFKLVENAEKKKKKKEKKSPARKSTDKNNTEEKEMTAKPATDKDKSDEVTTSIK